MIAFPLFAAAFVLGSAPASGQHFQRLYSNDAVASSFLQNDWNRYTENYHPKYALDDDPKTAWVEGVPGNGEGESLTIRFSALSSARTLRVRIRNGYQASKELLDKNAAPRDVTLSLLDAAGEEVVTKKASLTRTMGWQQVELSPPAHTPIAFLKLRIDSTWPGSRYRDTCISDVQLLVDSEVPYNAKAELAKQVALTAWIKERKDVAKYFATLPKSYPFAATHFDAQVEFEHSDPSHEPFNGKPYRKKVKGFVPLDQLVRKGTYPPAWKTLFDKAQTERIQRLMKIAKAKGASLGKAWYRPVFTSRIPLPDGLPYRFHELANYFERDNFALFEATQSKTHSEWHPADVDASSETDTSQLRVVFADGPEVAGGRTPIENRPLQVKQQPRVVELYYWVHENVSERDGYEETRHVLVAYDEHERPSEVLILANRDADWSITAISFALDAKGRVEKLTTREAAVQTQPYAEPGDEDAVESNNFRMTSYLPTSQR